MSKLVIPVADSDHFQGNPRAAITLLEYGDYECPYCGRAYPIIKNIQETLGTSLKFVFRNFPLSQIHPHAALAAEAAEAAGAQGKFWEMHDGLFEQQRHLGTALYSKLAQDLGLDMNQFQEDMESRKFEPRVKQDFMGGVRSGVNGTPGFFVDGERYDESWDYDSLLEFLQK